MLAFHQSADQCTDVYLDANHGSTLDFLPSSQMVYEDLRESSILHVYWHLAQIAHYLVVLD